MKRSILSICCSLLCLSAFAQGLFGFQGGLGYTLANKGRITPAVEGYYLYKLGYRVHIGGEVAFRRYSFLYEAPAIANIQFGDMVSIRHKASYGFLMPKVEYAIGYYKYFRLSAAFGPGFLMGGSQYTNQHQPYWTTTAGSYGVDTIAANTRYNMRGIIMGGTLGISERLPTGGYWSIILSQEFGFMTGGLSKGNPALPANYVALSVGIMHKYPMVFVEY